MNLTRRAGMIGRNVALWVFMVMAVLTMALGALGFFVAALLFWLSEHIGPAGATAVAGAVLLLFALATGIISSVVLRRMRARQPSLAMEGMGAVSLGLRLATMAIRRDPRKAVLGALIAGAIAEYFAGNAKPKG
ncbi:hypothetical protein [Acidocella sp.]|uniref:hypothetical protein n=1 Tax=Acidocella sp. TaxID=50710 RepID=UPI002607208E|nr:hypothetical protein [Acidocella sp.]